MKTKPKHSIYHTQNNRLHHMIYCGHCEHLTRIAKGDRFCRRCGTEIDWAEPIEMMDWDARKQSKTCEGCKWLKNVDGITVCWLPFKYRPEGVHTVNVRTANSKRCDEYDAD